MIGADEFTIQDEHGNVVFVTRQPNADRSINDYLARAKSLGFRVSGRAVHACRSDVQTAMYQDFLRREYPNAGKQAA